MQVRLNLLDHGKADIIAIIMRLSEKRQLHPFPIYPILFGIYPVLYLWSANRNQHPAYVVIPSLVVTLVALLVVYLLAMIVIRNVQRAALCTLAGSFFIFSYGHFMTITRHWGWTLQHRYMLPLVGVLLLGLLVVILVKRFDYAPVTKILNTVTAALVLVAVIPAAVYYLLSAPGRVSASSAAPAPAASNAPADPSGQRDVYFIILDNYGRQDHLMEIEGFDNGPMVAELTKRGFQFPKCALGNYPGTAPVITSVLNMSYLDQWGITEADYLDKNRHHVLLPLIQESQVIEKFRAYGYHTVTFRGFMSVIDIQNADTYVNFDHDTAYQNRLETYNFQTLYIQTTLLHPINEQFRFYPEWLAEHGPKFLFPYLPRNELLAERFLKIFEQNIYAFDRLAQIPAELDSPKFVYAHVYSAHWPFMMKPDGTMRLPFTEDKSTEGYLDGVQYTNKRVLEVVDAILANSEVAPVIIIQGDHANGSEGGGHDWTGEDRLKIFSAYYLPGEAGQYLPDSISPVNNFRFVFKHYFGEPVDLLPDVNYYLDSADLTVKTASPSCMP